MIPRGRPALPIVLAFDRDLTATDHHRLKTEYKTKAPTPAVQRLKASHQAAARYLASGRGVHATAMLVGYSPARITDMQNNDPGFQELVEYYRQQIEELNIAEEVRFRSKSLINAELAIDEIRERLEDDRIIKTIPFSELRALSGDVLDRTVLPKKNAAPIVNIPEHVTFRIGDRDLRPTPSLPGDTAKDITPTKTDSAPSEDTPDGQSS